ncbi:MAG: hypothetical protein ACYTET_03200 [Planctomycetota bacterium]|jgi:hypothetical protein
MTIPKDLRCPKCGSKDIAEIIYGPAEMTGDLLARIQSKKAVIRNDTSSGPQKTWYCNYCDYEW